MTTPPPDPFERALAAYSAREQARAIAPPPGFADRTAAALARPRGPWKAVAATAVGLLLAGVGVGSAVWPRPQPAPPVAPEPPAVYLPDTSTPDAPNIGDTLSEAGTALAKLTRTTAEKATPRTLLPEPGKVDTPKPPADVPPGADAIAAVPAAARSGLEPVAGGTRRAFRALLRDTGLRAN